ncbi:MAG: glucose dehydrogenase [Tepidisphaeraceae bacterium]
MLNAFSLSPRSFLFCLCCAVALALCGCFVLSPSQGGGQNVRFSGARKAVPADVLLPPGYAIAVVAADLNFPSGICFDDRGGVYVIESGSRTRQPDLVRVNPDGTTTAIASGAAAPWTGVDFYQGYFYVTAGGASDAEYSGSQPVTAASSTDSDKPGSILKIDVHGKTTPLLENLPSYGESHATGPVVFGDGYLYFGQTSATNAGVVDPGASGPQFSRAHDIPGADIQLVGQNFQSTPTDVTGGFSAFGEPTAAGQTIPGQIPCTGSVMRVPLAGGPPELVAWGFRAPIGVARSPDEGVFVADQQYEDRGTRPVSGCGDLLWSVSPGLWYGFPDFYAGIPLSASRQFSAVGKPPPQPLLAAYPNTPPKPAAVLPMHAGAAGLDFSRNPSFGHVGEVFIAEFGDTAPRCGKVLSPTGFDVVRVDISGGVSHVFAANKSGSGPASKLGSAGIERPIAARFDPSGDALYIVDFGIVTVGDDLQLQRHPGTGVLWKITREPGK